MNKILLKDNNLYNDVQKKKKEKRKTEIIFQEMNYPRITILLRWHYST